MKEINEELASQIQVSSERLSILRNDHKISQTQLASMLGVSHSTVSKWECRKVLITAKCAQKLANLYSINAAWIQGYDSPKEINGKENNPLLANIMTKLLALNNEDLQIVSSLVDRLKNK
jgi:transcriptional regulator with XRE-family HTH domain